MKRFLGPIIVGAAALILLAGCGGGADHNDQDVSFTTDMVPHHQQAVEMADLAATRASDPKVKALAARIKAAQDPEIRTMQGWLSDWAAKASDMGGMDHGGGSTKAGGSGGMGMMSDADMGALKAASGAPFDRMFLTAMISHHNGAIEMAKTEQAKGKYQPAKELAKTIQETQAQEIAEMQQILTGLPAS